MQIEFVGQSARDSDSLNANTSRLVNVYREPIVAGGRSQYLLKSVPGLASFAALPGVFVRAMDTVNRKLYAVSAGGLYEISATGVYTLLGAVNDDVDTTIAGNNADVTIVANGQYYRWNGSAINQPTTGAFSSFGGHDYIGNYTVLTEKNGRRFQWSGIADANSLPGLNFSTADGRDDNLIRPFAVNGVLYLFAETSHEVWYLTGQAGANAFERQAGGVVDLGLKAFGLITRIPGAAFFVGDDGRAHILSGSPQPVSTPPVETAIKYGSPRACFSYEDEGHTFCVITFRDRAAWVYDVAAGEWHERAEGVEIDPWTATASAKFGGQWYAGRDDGKVLRFTRNDSDAGSVLVREATSRTLYQDGQRTTLQELELFPRQGFSAGQITLEISRDSGATWTAPKARDIGPIGNYAGRIIWRSLGQARQITARIRWTDPNDITMLAEGRIA